jgi:hypothetical protein
MFRRITWVRVGGGAFYLSIQRFGPIPSGWLCELRMRTKKIKPATSVLVLGGHVGRLVCTRATVGFAETKANG